MTGRNVEYAIPPRDTVAAGRRDGAARSTGSRCAGRSATCRSRCAPARSSGSPGSSARAAPRSSRPSSARARRPPAPCSVAGKTAARRLGQRRGRRRHRAVPRGAQEPGPDPRRAGLPQHHALDLRAHRQRVVPRRGRRARGGARADRGARRAAVGPRPQRPHPVRRQPAEGPARALARARLPGAAARRAHPRRRRRRPRRDLRPDRRPGRPGRRRRGRLQRDPGGARPGRPRPGHLRRARGPRRTRRPASTSTACSTSSWKEVPRERAGRHGSRAGRRRVAPGSSRSPRRPTQARRPPHGRRRAQPRPGDRPGRALRLRRHHRRRAVRQHRQPPDDPAARVGARRDQHRDDLRHHRRRHRPVGRLGDRPGLGLGLHAGHADHGAGLALDRHGRRARSRSGSARGLDQRRAHRLREGRRVHRDAGHAGRRPRPGGDHRQPADPDRQGRRASSTSSGVDLLGIPMLVWIFVAGRRRRAGSCSTAPRSAAAPSRSAATPRPRGSRASRSSATRCTCTPSAV